MQTTRRTNQGGSTAVFLVVSAVLAMAVISGMYAVQKRSADMQATDPVAVTTPSEKKNDTKQSSSDKKADDTAKQQAADEKKKQQAEADKQAAEKKAAEQKAATEQHAAAEKQQAQQQVAIPQTSTAPAQTSEKLPQTGPSDTIWQVFGGAVLLGVTIAYLKSYQYRFGSLL